MGAKRLGMTSSGWVSITWYCSKKASWASFQLTGSLKASHHSVRMASTFQASRMLAKGSMQLRSGGAPGSRLIHAQPPQTSQRTGTRSMSPAVEVVLGEGLGPRHEGVLAVEAVAPAVEGAGEAALEGAPALDDLDAAVAARVLIGRHLVSDGAHHDDGAGPGSRTRRSHRHRGSLRAGRPSATPGARAARPRARRSQGRSSAPWGCGRGPRTAKGTRHRCRRSSSSGTRTCAAPWPGRRRRPR